MQLILETEAAADISVKMSTVEESLDINLKDSIENLKNDFCNGNKENIECQKNIITNTEVNTGIEHKEHTDDNEPELPSTAENTKLELEINNDDHNKSSSTAQDFKLELNFREDGAGEEVSSNGNSYENSNSNSTHNTDIYNCDGKNAVVEETEADAENELVNDTVKQETEVIRLSSKEDSNLNTECRKAKEKEVTDKINKIENNIKNTEIVTKVLNNLDTEIKLDNTTTNDEANNSEAPVEVFENKSSLIADEVDEEISEMALEVDKTISEISMQVDEDSLEDIDPIDRNISKDSILIDEVESDNIAPKAEDTLDNEVQMKSERDIEVPPENIFDLDLEKTDKNESKPEVSEESEVSTKATDKTKNNNESETKVVVSSEYSEDDTKTVDNKTDDNKSETVVLDDTEHSEAETKAVDESDTEKIDDDVIQIESEQDSEVLKNMNGKAANDVVDLPEKVVEDDAQKVADSDETVLKVDTSKTLANENSENKSDEIDCDLVANEIKSTDDKVVILDIDEVKEVPKVKEQIEESKVDTSSQSVTADQPKKTHILKLSNTLDILSDDEEDQPQTKPQKSTETTPSEKQCINIEDDDDIMLIDEDTDPSKDNKTEPVQPMDTEEKKEDKNDECSIDLENGEAIETKKVEETVAETEKDPVVATPEVKSPSKDPETTETVKEAKEEVKVPPKPLLADNFLKSCKKNLADMTRDELEEFCILKIVESIVDRSNLGEIKSKLKSMAQNIEEHKKKAMMLTKQNRDLQLVLKSVQDDYKKKPDSVITPLKITRSVGMQVLMTEKIGARKKPNNVIPLAPPNNNRNVRTPNQSPRAQKSTVNQQIPVPRLVPAAANPVAKSPMTQNSPMNNQVKTANQFNGARMSPPVQKAEKRPHNRIQSVTVDLTDDEPPTKVTPRSSPAPPVRLVSPQNLMSTPRPQATTTLNSPRKVYIPISGPQGQSIRPGQTIMLKSVPPPGPRQRSAAPNLIRGPSPSLVKRVQNNRHPAPLPDAMKQYQPPNWKTLPPAPDLKLSKVENGIVISWKIEGYQEDSYEEIASYQLYAYQETSTPPSTALWKKIGDVKALPLPMACTLTQFMAGFKYYFAVRAVDVRSRLGPFSLPGSILLLNKM